MIEIRRSAATFLAWWLATGTLGLVPTAAAAAQDDDAPTLDEGAPAVPPGIPSVELPPPEPIVVRSRWQIDAGLSGTVDSSHVPEFAGLVRARSGKGGDASLGFRYFLAPLVDDGAPRSLQPFLSRSSTLGLGIGGGGFETHTESSPDSRSSTYLSARAEANGYLTRSFALTASVDYQHATVEASNAYYVGESERNSFWGSAGLGVRFGDVRLDASYRFEARESGGRFADLRWGSVDLAGYAALFRTSSGRVWGRVLTRGGLVGLDYSHYLNQDIGLFAGGSGGSGLLYETDQLTDQVGGYLGASYWVTPTTRLWLSYNLTFKSSEVPFSIGGSISRTTRDETMAHRVVIEASFRLP